MSENFPFKIKIEDRGYVVYHLKTVESGHHKVKIENVGKVREVFSGHFSSLQSALVHIHRMMLTSRMEGFDAPLNEWIAEHRKAYAELYDMIKNVISTPDLEF